MKCKPHPISKNPLHLPKVFIKNILHHKIRHIALFWLWMAAFAICLHSLIPHHHHFDFGYEKVCNLSSQQTKHCEHGISKTNTIHHCNEQKHQDDCNGCQFSVVSTDLKKIFKTNFLASIIAETFTIKSSDASTNYFVKNALFTPSQSVRIPQLRAPPLV